MSGCCLAFAKGRNCCEWRQHRLIVAVRRARWATSLDGAASRTVLRGRFAVWSKQL